MRVNLIGLAVHDVDAAPIRLPAWDAGSEMLVGVGDSLVVLFFVFVLFGVRSGIATLPELLNEVISFFVVVSSLKAAFSSSVIIQTTSSSSHFL
jgi:hypothetical protein